MNTDNIKAWWVNSRPDASHVGEIRRALEPDPYDHSQHEARWSMLSLRGYGRIDEFGMWSHIAHPHWADYEEICARGAP